MQTYEEEKNTATQLNGVVVTNTLKTNGVAFLESDVIVLVSKLLKIKFLWMEMPFATIKGA